tara:strand:+ start:239 stop:613 length:375 start_codon:yes stop_codon:yes gene_type:complete
MAAPSGPGTEVLKSIGSYNLNSNSYTISTKASGSDINAGLHHILTIISITVCNKETSTADIAISLNDGTNTMQILHQGGTIISPQGTFVFNDKIVVPSNHILTIQSASSKNTDWYISYIDQDWS